MTCDHGNEFVGLDFKELLKPHRLSSNVIAVKNPRINAILERVHAVFSKHFRFLHALDPKKIMQDSYPLGKQCYFYRLEHE